MPDVIAITEQPPDVVAITETTTTVAVQAAPTITVVKEGVVGPRGIDTNINKMTAAVVAPADPAINDLWIDIS